MLGTGHIFPDDTRTLSSTIVVPNWMDYAIITMQGRNKDFFFKASSPEDVVEFITAGAWLDVQPKDDFIPVQCVGFDSVEKISTSRDLDKGLEFASWRGLCDRWKPMVFVASRDKNYVVKATTSVSKQEFLDGPHPSVETIANYPITAVKPRQLAECITAGQPLKR